MDSFALLEQLPYPQTVREALRKAWEQNEGWIQEKCAEAYSGEAPAFPVCALEPEMRLAVVHALLAVKYEAYRAKARRTR